MILKSEDSNLIQKLIEKGNLNDLNSFNRVIKYKVDTFNFLNEMKEIHREELNIISLLEKEHGYTIKMIYEKK